MMFIVVNSGDITFDFTAALHTYFNVNDVTRTTVSGLGGLQYADKLRGGQVFTEENEPQKTVTGPMDRVCKKRTFLSQVTC